MTLESRCELAALYLLTTPGQVVKDFDLEAENSARGISTVIYEARPPQTSHFQAGHQEYFFFLIHSIIDLAKRVM